MMSTIEESTANLSNKFVILTSWFWGFDYVKALSVNIRN
jgi:hypothetical protein